MSEDDINRSKMDKLQIQLERISNITKEMMKISRYQTKDCLNEKIFPLKVPPPTVMVPKDFMLPSKFESFPKIVFEAFIALGFFFI